MAADRLGLVWHLDALAHQFAHFVDALVVQPDQRDLAKLRTVTSNRAVADHIRLRKKTKPQRPSCGERRAVLNSSASGPALA